MDYGYTTVGIKTEYRDLINQVADYHGLKTTDFIPMLIAAYAYMSQEGRESILDIGAKIVAFHKAGMAIDFQDSLLISEDCEKLISHVQSAE